MKSNWPFFVKQSSELPFNQKSAEYTFEANPGDLSREKLKILYDSGVNRLSFGVQSFNDELLKRIGRTHRAQKYMKRLNWLKKLALRI